MTNDVLSQEKKAHNCAVLRFRTVGGVIWSDFWTVYNARWCKLALDVVLQTKEKR